MGREAPLIGTRRRRRLVRSLPLLSSRRRRRRRRRWRCARAGVGKGIEARRWRRALHTPLHLPANRINQGDGSRLNPPAAAAAAANETKGARAPPSREWLSGDCAAVCFVLFFFFFSASLSLRRRGWLGLFCRLGGGSVGCPGGLGSGSFSRDNGVLCRSG